MLNTQLLIDKFKDNIGSKSDYLPKTLNEARKDFIHRAKTTVVLLRDGQVRPYHPAPMAKQQKMAKSFCVKIGYGNNNAYFANNVLIASQVLKYKTAIEAASCIEELIIPLAEDGAFDDGLKDTLEGHKKRAEARKKTEACNREAFSNANQAIDNEPEAMVAE